MSTLHFDTCGCSLWAEDDGVHISPCEEPGHVERMVNAAAIAAPDTDLIFDAGPSRERLRSAVRPPSEGTDG